MYPFLHPFESPIKSCSVQSQRSPHLYVDIVLSSVSAVFRLDSPRSLVPASRVVSRLVLLSLTDDSFLPSYESLSVFKPIVHLHFPSELKTKEVL